MYNRRKFIRDTSIAAGLLLVSNPLKLVAEATKQKRLTVLHTNDTHSRLLPFPMDGSANQGLGGVAPRAALIEQIRKEQENVLLLDAGDIFQGTPFFNIYKGEPEMKAMRLMQYDGITMGNHDFDAGMEDFALQLSKGGFPLLICNYDFTKTPLEHMYAPYKIYKRGGLKIGVTGVGIEPAGLIPENLYGNTKYLDPVQQANTQAEYLKKKEGCDMVICLSHLGYKYKEGSNKICDDNFAPASEYIDLIIGGHTHTFFDEPKVYKNKLGHDVVVNQVGWAGIVLGRLDFTFNSGNRAMLEQSKTITVGKAS